MSDIIANLKKKKTLKKQQKNIIYTKNLKRK